jgi:hypothetical protein
LSAGRFACLLGVLIFANFPGVLLGLQTFIFRDFGLFSYPVAAFQRQCFWRGELPLWNPYNYCGLPFLAQWNTMALYPPALIYLLLPLTWSLPFFCLLHLFWGGLGMFFLARHWTQHSLGSALAGVIFAFNGLSQNFLMWPSHIATFAWVPWVLWLVPVACQTGGRNLVWAALAAALQMLGGAPETILLTWLFLLLLVAGDSLNYLRFADRLQAMLRLPFRSSVDRPESVDCAPILRCTPGAVWLRFAVLVLLVALVSAAQLLPFLQLLAHSQRETGSGASGWSMPLSGWANFLVPLFQTSPTPQGVFMQSGQYWTSSYYAGIGTVLLAIVALRHAGHWRVWVLAGSSAVCLMLAFGENSPLYPALRSCLPALGFMRYPVKFVLLVLALAPLLAASGLRAITSAPGKFGRFELGVGLLLLALVGAISLLDSRGSTWDWGTAWQRGLSRAGFLILLISLVGLLVRATGWRPIVYGSLLLVVCWGDLVTHAPNQNPAAAPAVYEAGLRASQIQWSPEPRVGGGRAMVAPAAEAAMKYNVITNLERNYLLDRLGLLADCNLLDGIPQAQGFFSLTPTHINDAALVPYVQTNLDFSPLLDLMGVCQITAPGQTFDWVPRPSAMPLVTAGQQPVFADDHTVFQTFAAAQTDFRRLVFLPPEARRGITAGRQSGAHVLATEFANQSVAIQTEASAPSMVVISQTWFPAWKAYVDGRPTTLWRANFAFQALEVPAGRHSVKLVYEDNAFRAGVVLSGLGLAACLWLWLSIPMRKPQAVFSRPPVGASANLPMPQNATR